MAYEMHISYWSSDVCASDLGGLDPSPLSQTLHSPGRNQIVVALGGTSQAGVGRGRVNQCLGKAHLILGSQTQYVGFLDRAAGILACRRDKVASQRQAAQPGGALHLLKIGRASGRERVCQYV